MDSKSPSSVRSGIVGCFYVYFLFSSPCFIYLFVFMLTLVAVFSVCCRHMPLDNQTLQSYSLSLLQIYNCCWKSKHHCNITSHRPRQQQQAVRTGCLKITLVVKWDQSVPSVGNAMHNILSSLPLLPFLILHSLSTVLWLHFALYVIHTVFFWQWLYVLQNILWDI